MYDNILYLHTYKSICYNRKCQIKYTEKKKRAKL